MKNCSVKKMVKRCVAAVCSNTYRENVSFFKFPCDPVMQQKWVKQVQRTRAEWSGPSEHSVICSVHFTDDCFETNLTEKFGLEKQKRLKEDAVPTIFRRFCSQSQKNPSLSTEPEASCSSKRKGITEEPDLSKTADDFAPTKKKRSAYEKRERARVRL